MDGPIKYPLQEVLYQGESIFLYRVTRFQASTVHENPILRPNQSPYIIVGLWTQILLQHIKLTTVVRFWCLRSPDMILGNSNYKKNKIFKTLANRGPFTPAPDEVQKKQICIGYPPDFRADGFTNFGYHFEIHQLLVVDFFALSSQNLS